MAVITDVIYDHADKPYEQGNGPVLQWHYAGMQRTYGIQVNWQSPAGEKSMYYDMLMHCKGVKDENATWEITKNNIYIDNKKTEAPLELLAIACAEPCYPFEFTTTKDGRITGLTGTEKIKERFADAKAILLRDFGGEVALQYISATEAAIDHPQQLESLVTTDLWLSLFFAPIVGRYENAEKTKPITINFPFFGFEQPLIFNGIIAIGKPDFDNKAQSIIAGAELDNSTIIEGDKLLNGKIEATYDIDIPGHTIRNISCHTAVVTNKGEHHLWLNGYQTQTNAAPESEKENTKSKSWWSVF
jgi:hypothetical protein